MSLYNLISNNRFINNILIATGYDAKLQMAAKQWKLFNYNKSKTVQENAGFSHTKEVEEALALIKEKLKDTLSRSIPNKGTVLDFGCGPGIYVDILHKDYQVDGIDVSEAMIKTAKENLPNNTFYLGNFIDYNFDKKYDAIYSISVLEYVPVSKIHDFFKKCSSLLNENGIIFIQYPHALCKADLYYPDRNYICYSPSLITDVASNYFTVIENKQSYDGRDTCYYDLKPYPTPSKIFTNGYLLIAKKK
jgi:2-polyprenyl-3-methyl-5-hydroxy-6-metoxy-1,4-benzoquinol methylase